MQPKRTMPPCEQCGAPVRSAPTKTRPRRFCSPACRATGTTVLPPTACVICAAGITRGHHPSRVRRYCSAACYKARSRPLADRFWAKVNKDGPVPRHAPDLGPCWIWTGATDSSGYGKLGLGKRGDGLAKASHISWALHYGSFPGVLDVCHACDSPLCVRPSHLWLGTGTDNIRDAQRKGRLVGAGKGERHHRACLTENDIRSIRSRRARGTTLGEMAVEYRVSLNAIWCVVHRKTWDHVV